MSINPNLKSNQMYKYKKQHTISIICSNQVFMNKIYNLCILIHSNLITLLQIFKSKVYLCTYPYDLGHIKENNRSKI